jgi:Fe-S-cluster-containing hydrogenase component 2
MKKGLKVTGILCQEEVMNSTGMPTKKRMEEGPVAIIECTQEIPCDPCVDACRHGAIQIGEDITRPPRLIEKKCIGCGICIASCPGLAIFVVDLNYSPEGALLMIPYEFIPLPKVNFTVITLNREGRAVGKAKVVKVSNTKKSDRTPVISLLIPKDLILDIRNIQF